MIIKRIQWIGLVVLFFGHLSSCAPKSGSHQKRLPVIDPKNQGQSVLESFHQQYQTHELLRQNGKTKEPIPNFNLPNQKQYDLLIRRLARTGEVKQRFLEMKEEAVPYLCSALLDPNRFASPFIRRECALILGELKYSSAAKYLVLAMQRDVDTFVQLACISSLAKIRSPEAIAPMRTHFFLKETSIFIRSALALALAEAKDLEMIPHFKKTIEEIPATKKPYRNSKDRYLIWHLREALKILTGDLNTYFPGDFTGSGIFAHPGNPK